jgi:transposase InsO family protein
MAWLTDLVLAVHAGSRGTYGWRRVHAELIYGHGIIVNRKTVRKIMRAQQLHGLPGMKKLFKSKANLATAVDLVERAFDRPAPNQLWVTDITEHPTREGKVYCCVILDVFSRRVVGWAIDSHQATPLVTTALGMEDTRRGPRRASTIGESTRCCIDPLSLVSSPPGPSHSGRSSPGCCRRWAASAIATTLRRHRGVLGPDADRAPQPQTMEDTPRAGQRNLRIPRNLPQPATPPQRPRLADTHRI